MIKLFTVVLFAILSSCSFLSWSDIEGVGCQILTKTVMAEIECIEDHEKINETENQDEL